MARSTSDLSGQVFGTSTAVSASPTRNPKGQVLWVCLCDCGEVHTVVGSDLIRGRHKKCPKCRDTESQLSPYKTLYGNYERGARQRGYSFEMDFDHFIELTKMSCSYCNLPPSQTLKKTDAKYGITYTGVDRKDNSLGYTRKNCVPCCKFCNLAKSTYPVEEFVSWLAHVRTSEAPSDEIVTEM